MNEGGLVGAALVVSGEPAAAADPRQESCEDPALREYDEAVAVADDLKLPRAGASDGRFHPGAPGSRRRR